MNVSSRFGVIIAVVVLGVSCCLGAGTLLFENSDFEKGSLENWIATGTAFEFQPLKGDYLKVRGPRANHQGTYWVGTFDKCSDPSRKPYKNIQGDRPIGTLTSAPFEILGNTIHFLLGGGLHQQEDGIYVALLVDGRTVMKSKKGFNRETMQGIVWDVRKYKGKTAEIFISDQCSKAWGHINADDFRYGERVARPVAAKPAQVAPSIADSESGTVYPVALEVIVRQYPGAAVAFSHQEDLKVNAQLHKPGGDPDNAVAFYKREVLESGWVLAEESEMLGSKVLTFKKNDLEFIASIKDIGGVALVITLALAKQ